jgi:hypothetical protein
VIAASKYATLFVVIAALICSAANPSAFVPSNTKVACCACCAANGSGATCAMCQNVQRNRASCGFFPMPCRPGQSVHVSLAPDIAFMHYLAAPSGVSPVVSQYPRSPDERAICLSEVPLFHPPCA